MNNNYTIEAEAKIRQKVTIESSIEQLENELRGEIARSIKRSEMKVIYLIKKAEESKSTFIQNINSSKKKQDLIMKSRTTTLW